MAQYPQCLIAELAKYGRQPTGNKDWDAAVLSVLRKNEREKDAPWLTLHQCALNLRRESEKARAQAYNLADPNVYSAHSSFLVYIANSVVLAPQRRKFIVDDDNKQVLRFLLLYFNNCPLAEEVFPRTWLQATQEPPYTGRCRCWQNAPHADIQRISTAH